MTVGAVRGMPNDEYVTWGVWYARKQQDEELAQLRQKG